MDIEFALGAYLAGRSAITAIVGSKIYADKAPQGIAAPYIRYEQVGGEKYYHSLGASTLAEADIRITVKAKSYVKAKELFEVLRNYLDGFAGSWSTVSIDSAFLGTPRNISEPDRAGGDASDCAVVANLVVRYTQPAPTNAGA